jgi:hypothetical protein
VSTRIIKDFVSSSLFSAVLLVLTKCSSNCLLGSKSFIGPSFACECLHVRVGYALEPPDQTTRVFLVQIKFTPYSLLLARKVFGEMQQRQ